MNLSLSRRARTLLASLAIVGGGIALTTPIAEAANSNGAVYVLSNQPTGNDVLVFARHADGTLSAPVSVGTGGNGTGGGLGSQGAVVLDGSGRHLYAVNAGSNSITSFRVRPNGLERVGVVDSGGVMPTSIAVDGDLVYVLNAGGAGLITGFTAHDGDLEPIAGSTRPLSAAACASIRFAWRFPASNSGPPCTARPTARSSSSCSIASSSIARRSVAPGLIATCLIGLCSIAGRCPMTTGSGCR